MTARYVFHTGVHTPFMDATQNALLLDEVTVAQRLKSAGYATHAPGWAPPDLHQGPTRRLRWGIPTPFPRRLSLQLLGFHCSRTPN